MFVKKIHLLLLTLLLLSNSSSSLARDVFNNVTVQSVIDNRFLSSENASAPVKINRSQAMQWEKFSFEHLGENRTAIRCSNGSYLSSENGYVRMICDRQTRKEWERFRLESLGNDTFAIKASNQRYVIFDSTGDKSLWATSETIANDKERFVIRNIDSNSFGLNSAQLIKDDMNMPHQARPRAVSETLGWAIYPRVGYGNQPPEAHWNAMLTWGQAYAPASGNPANNVRFQIRNMQAWYLSKSQDKWIMWQQGSDIGGANYREDFANDSNLDADIRDESNNGGGISSTLVDAHNFHFWLKNRVPIDQSDIAGVWLSLESRLIENDPNAPYDLQNARIMMSVGGDYWESLEAQWDEWKTNGDIAIGRFRFLSPRWQAFNAHTLTDEQIENNPPPFAR